MLKISLEGSVYQEAFLVANTYADMNLRIPFLTLNNIDMNFCKRKNLLGEAIFRRDDAN